mmetsp:Transcript_31820/g.36762  ORF Transcript_31820/g.36762 Transcript_31820/m.36762 type:complete len:108 (-) Transcript_31820:76-399(-)
MPPLDLTASQLLHFFSRNFDFNSQQTVIIMDAHKIGVARRTNLGFVGELGWVRDSLSLDNEYYQMLIGAENKRSDFIEEAFNWSRKMKINSDILITCIYCLYVFTIS